LRAAAGALCLLILGVLGGLLVHIRHFQFDEFVNSIQALDSSISSVVFIGAAILFLVSWENRIKRHRALRALHELRSIAHIIDMHQLTKDPESHFPGSSGLVPRPSMKALAAPWNPASGGRIRASIAAKTLNLEHSRSSNSNVLLYRAHPGFVEPAESARQERGHSCRP